MHVRQVDEIQPPEEFSIEWDTSSAPSGVQFYVLTHVKRMVLVR